MKIESRIKFEIDPPELKRIIKWCFLMVVIGMLIYVGETKAAVALMAGTGITYLK